MMNIERPTQAELDQSLRKCRDEYVASGLGRNPSACYLPGYLKARRQYHKLLVVAELLGTEKAEHGPERLRADS